MELRVVHIDNGDILSALSELAEIDNDLCGENGEEYLWDRARENGFETNVDFLIDVVKELPDKECVSTFVDEWMFHDDYYTDYEVELLYDDNGTPNWIVLSYITD